MLYLLTAQAQSGRASYDTTVSLLNQHRCPGACLMVPCQLLIVHRGYAPGEFIPYKLPYAFKIVRFDPAELDPHPRFLV
jgi:hypothetical protein